MIADPVFADIFDILSEDVHGQPHSHTRSEAGISSHSHSHSAHSHAETRPTQAEIDLAQDKVRSTLRCFVRDWSEEGAMERRQSYDPCLEALEKHWKGKQKEKEVKVLVPGCGLGRLAMEIAARGQ